MKRSFTITIDVDVCDADALRTAAVEHAVEHDGLNEAEAEAMVGPEGDPNLHTCLITLFDPGLSPEGCIILGSQVEELNLMECQMRTDADVITEYQELIGKAQDLERQAAELLDAQARAKAKFKVGQVLVYAHGRHERRALILDIYGSDAVVVWGEVSVIYHTRRLNKDGSDGGLGIFNESVQQLRVEAACAART